MKLFYFLFFLAIGQSFAQTLSGYVHDQETGESLANVNISVSNTRIYVQSNPYGFFSLQAAPGDSVIFSFLGYENNVLVVPNKSTEPLNTYISLKPVSTSLNEVTVTAKTNDIYKSTQPGRIRLDAKTIKEIPMLLGEKDPIKALQFLPGIQEVSEGSASLSVRGGDVDQNLMLLDEATVYNANHLFGFFSTFNADPISQLEAYKGAFPAQYGGRLSSIIDVRMRDGNKKEFHGEGGIGLIASRLLLEGPIIKNKASFLVSGRRTYADLLILPFQNDREKTGYNFGDLNAKLNFNLNQHNDLFFSYYAGRDSFYQKNKIPRRDDFLFNNTMLNWQNQTLTTRWNHIYSPKLFQNLTFIYTKYGMRFGENTTQDYLMPPRFQEVNLNSGIEDFSFKTDFDFFINNQLQMKWGGILTQHQFSPRNFNYNSSRSFEAFENNSELIESLEGAAYLSFKYETPQFFAETGLRMSYFQNTESLRPEPRFTIGKNLDSRNTLSFSYSKMNQYLHQISNTGNGLPTDVWIPATNLLTPSSADIISTSWFFKPSKGLNVTLEAYYKWIYGNTAYKSGVNFLGIGQGAATTPFEWENSLTQGRAWNYGYELSVQKTLGKWTGFGGYTLAWSISQFDDLNSGKPFYNQQDRRHIFETSVQFKPGKRISFAANFIFATGNALPLPERFFFREDRFNNYLEAFSGVNTFRAENYHRLDLSVQLKNKKNAGSWEFGVYNTYFKENPYNYDLKDNIDVQNRTQNVSILRSWLLPVIPSITYNFKF